MIKKEIIYSGQKALVACDENCTKAWGINNRPTVQLDNEDVDDFAYLSDNELGIAPIYSDVMECDTNKPRKNEDKLNKWCLRECERCYISNPGEFGNPIKLPDFSKRLYNLHSRNCSNI